MKRKQKIEKPMEPARRLVVYTRQRGAEPEIENLTPRQRRRYAKKIPYWQRLHGGNG